MLEFIAVFTILKLQVQAVESYVNTYSYDTKIAHQVIYDSTNFYKYTPIIINLANKHGVEPELAIAVATVESKFKPTAGSHKGAYGLMQLMPITAKEMNVEDRYDPRSNLSGGIRYLSKMLKRFGSKELALAAYNAGPRSVLVHGGIPPYVETQKYVSKVLHLYSELKSS